MEMTHKQRMLAALKGEKTDRPCFSPFLAYYFDALPAEIRNKGELDFLQKMGADPLMRGKVRANKLKNNICSVDTKVNGNKRYVTYKTPKGDLYEEYTYVTKGNTWFLTKHAVENEKDAMILIEYFKDMEVVPDIETVNNAVKELGEDGLYISIVGTHEKTAFQRIIESWCGTINAVYLCADEEDLMHELVDAISEKNLKTVEYAAQSDVEVSLSWEDSSTGNVSPDMYREYIFPEIQNWCKTFHNNGKLYVQHACGLLKDILVPMAEQGIDCIESMTPPQTGNIEIQDAHRILPENVSIVGGIDPVFLLNATTEEVVEEGKRLIDCTKGRGFILSNSDSCPPGVEYEKFTALVNLVKNYRY